MKAPEHEIDLPALLSAESPHNIALSELLTQFTSTLTKLFGSLHQLPDALVTYREAWDSILQKCKITKPQSHPLKLAVNSFIQKQNPDILANSIRSPLSPLIKDLQGTTPQLKLWQKEMAMREKAYHYAAATINPSNYQFTPTPAPSIKDFISNPAIAIFHDISPLLANIKPQKIDSLKFQFNRIFFSKKYESTFSRLLDAHKFINNSATTTLPKSMWLQTLKSSTRSMPEDEKIAIYVHALNTNSRYELSTDDLNCLLPQTDTAVFSSLLNLLSSENAAPHIIRSFFHNTKNGMQIEQNINECFLAPLIDEVEKTIVQCIDADDWSLLYEKPEYIQELIHTKGTNITEVKKANVDSILFVTNTYLLPQLEKHYLAWKAELKKPEHIVITKNYQKTLPLIQLLATHLERATLDKSSRDETFGSIANPLPHHTTLKSSLPPSQMKDLEQQNGSAHIFDLVLQLFQLTAREPLTRAGRRNINNLRGKPLHLSSMQALLATSLAAGLYNFNQDIISLDKRPSCNDTCENEDLEILIQWVIKHGIAIPKHIGADIELYKASATVCHETFFSQSMIEIFPELMCTYESVTEKLLEDALTSSRLSPQDQLKLLTLLGSNAPEAIFKAQLRAIKQTAFDDNTTFNYLSKFDMSFRHVLRILNAPSASALTSSIEDSGYINDNTRNKNFFDGINHALLEARKRMQKSLILPLRNETYHSEEVALPSIYVLQDLWSKRNAIIPKFIQTSHKGTPTKPIVRSSIALWESSNPKLHQCALIISLAHFYKTITPPTNLVKPLTDLGLLKQGNLEIDYRYSREVYSMLGLNENQVLVLMLFLACKHSIPTPVKMHEKLIALKLMNCDQSIPQHVHDIILSAIEIKNTDDITSISFVSPLKKTYQNPLLLTTSIKQLACCDKIDNANIRMVSSICSFIVNALRRAIWVKTRSLNMQLATVEHASQANPFENPGLNRIFTFLNNRIFLLESSYSWSRNILRFQRIWWKHVFSDVSEFIRKRLIPSSAPPSEETYTSVMAELEFHDTYADDEEHQAGLITLAARAARAIPSLFTTNDQALRKSPTIINNALIMTKYGKASSTIFRRLLTPQPVAPTPKVCQPTPSPVARALF